MVFGLLVVEDYIGGRLVGRVVKDWFSGGDLSTVNYVRLVGALLTSVPRYNSVSFSAVDVDGVSRTFIVKANVGDVSWFWNTYGCDNVFMIAFGSGGGPPARTDYKLSAGFTSDWSPSLVVDEGAGVVVIEGRFIDGVTRSVCEVGLFLRATGAYSTWCFNFLMDRTVWSPCRTIPPGTPYIVRYRFVL